MYAADSVLSSVDDHTLLVLLLAGGALAGNLIWFIEAFRNASRDRTFALPVFCTMYWLVHDATYTVNFDKWFGDYDHWFPQLFWVALTITTMCELYCTWLIMTRGREEVAPGISPQTWPYLVVGTVFVSLAAWLTVKNVIGDPLYILTNGLALLSFGIFGLARVVRNGTMHGQSVRMWQGYTFCAACWFTVSNTVFGAEVRDWRWVCVGVAATGCGAVGIHLTSRMERVTASEQDPRPAPPSTIAISPGTDRSLA